MFVWLLTVVIITEVMRLFNLLSVKQLIEAHEMLLLCLVDWISDTRSQGCMDMQSLVVCLDRRGMLCSKARLLGYVYSLYKYNC